MDCLPPGMKPPPNPYLEFNSEDEPLSLREPAPLLPRLNLEPSSIEFLEKLLNGLHEGTPSGVFRVKIANMGECVPNVFHGLEHGNCKGQSFFQEATAYWHLLH